MTKPPSELGRTIGRWKGHGDRSNSRDPEQSNHPVGAERINQADVRALADSGSQKLTRDSVGGAFCLGYTSFVQWV